MIRCGIDASSSCTGLCIFDDNELIYYNKFRPYKKLDFKNNACQIIEQIVEVINKYTPNVIYMEDVPRYVTAKGVNPLVTLGAVQGIFYYELTHNLGYNIQYVEVSEWRKKLNLLKGERKRDEQKAKAVQFANETFGLNLQYEKGKNLVGNDDDIAEAICIVVSQMV